eukprot:evm.model.NODE_50810_length_14793_cov_36.489014.1
MTPIVNVRGSTGREEEDEEEEEKEGEEEEEEVEAGQLSIMEAVSSMAKATSWRGVCFFPMTR